MTTTTPILHTSPGSHHARRVALVIHELDLQIQERIVDVRPPGMGGENESEAFLALNPAGKVPVLQVGDFVLTESNAIMAYLCEGSGYGPLWPEDRAERALIARWQFFQAAHLSPTADGFLAQNLARPMMGQSPDGEALAELTQQFHRWGRVLDGALAGADYLVGNRLTCADLSVVTALMYAGAAKIPVAEHGNLAAWVDRLQARDSWKATQPPPMPMG